MDSGEYTSLYYIGQDEIGLNVSNRVSHIRIFENLKCHILEFSKG